jgi:hypothetical protein
MIPNIHPSVKRRSNAQLITAHTCNPANLSAQQKSFPLKLLISPAQRAVFCFWLLIPPKLAKALNKKAVS